jgi:hypothetical protein
MAIEGTVQDGRLFFGADNICKPIFTLAFLRNKVIPNLGNLYHITGYTLRRNFQRNYQARF